MTVSHNHVTSKITSKIASSAIISTTISQPLAQPRIGLQNNQCHYHQRRAYSQAFREPEASSFCCSTSLQAAGYFFFYIMHAFSAMRVGYPTDKSDVESSNYCVS
jgi:hypothetical protein